MKTYKQLITEGMEYLSTNKKTVFLGYNTKFGHRFNGTLTGIPKEKCWEMPVDEALIAGVASGLALTEKYFPVVCLERSNFLFNALDQIVHNIGMLPLLSGGLVKQPMLIRVCNGSTQPLHPGPQHCGDFGRLCNSLVLQTCLRFSELCFWEEAEVFYDTKVLDAIEHPTIVVEHKALYETYDSQYR